MSTKDPDEVPTETVGSLSESNPPGWDGPRLAREADGDEYEEEEDVEDGEEEDFDDDGEDSLAQQGRLLEELLRLQLSTQPEATSVQLPPKRRVQLYQPRTKLEQFEDILLESRLLERSAASDKLELLHDDGLDFDASDAIFNESISLTVRTEEKTTDCRCPSCQERIDIENEQLQEVERLRECWMELRADVGAVYRLVLDGAWKDSNREKPDLALTKERVHKLCWRDPHRLYKQLEALVKEIILDLKVKFVEILHKQAKNPSLAQDFIQSNYAKLSFDQGCIIALYVCSTCSQVS